MAKIDPESICPELRSLRQWLLWKEIEKRLKSGKIKKDKPPKAIDGRAGSSTDESTWTSFDEASATLEQKPRAFSGLGFVFKAGGGIVGIDLDGAFDESGVTKPWAQPWLDKLAAANAPIEMSPSGNGVHAFLRGTLVGSIKATDDHEGVEMYADGRYFTVTGIPVGFVPDVIPSDQSLIDDLYAFAKDLKAQQDAAKKAAEPPPPLRPNESGEAWVKRVGGTTWTPEERARACVATIRGGTDGSNGSAPMYNAACVCVEFGLDRETCYRVLKEVYSPKCNPPWDDDREVYHKIDQALKNATPGKLLAQDRPQQDRPWKRKPSDLDALLAKKARTDMGNGERLAARAKGRLRYCKPWGKWLAWDGKRYAADDTDAVSRHAKRAVRLMLAEASTITDDDDRKKHTMHAVASQSRAAISNMLAMAASEPGVPILPAEMDRDGWLLNCLNGTIDLRTGDLKPHDLADTITKLCPVEFDPAATCPLWDATLRLFFNNDQSLIAYWQRVCGYALVGVIRDHVMPIAYGEGSNGKSTILGTMLEVLGPDYAMKAPPDMLMAKVHDSHPTERADLFGKRLVVAIETAEGRRLDETMVKELTGGDKIRARRMREDFWEFSPTHTLIMATNHRPKIRGTDNGIWRRLKLVPFNVKVEGDKDDKGMGAKLRAEYPGILAWAVRGCIAWQVNGALREPDSVLAATSEYRSEQDVLGSFLAELTIQNPGIRTRCGEVYKAYQQWADDAGEKPLSLSEFGNRMRDRGITTKVSNGKWYVGIGLKSASLNVVGA